MSKSSASSDAPSPTAVLGVCGLCIHVLSFLNISRNCVPSPMGAFWLCSFWTMKAAFARRAIAYCRELAKHRASTPINAAALIGVDSRCCAVVRQQFS
eukprot:185741-Pyramimonas_sp.AAC.1